MPVQVIWLLLKSIGVAFIAPETNYFTICQAHNNGNILHHQSAISSLQYFSAVNKHSSNLSALDTHTPSIHIGFYQLTCPLEQCTFSREHSYRLIIRNVACIIVVLYYGMLYQLLFMANNFESIQKQSFWNIV